jgi:general secretion pathway protein G
MLKSAFTMIELVFVIVILGILASVAIPKLAATRDDAKITSKASEIQAILSEIPASFVASGEVKAPQEMSQVLKQMVQQGKATTSTGTITNSKGMVTLLTQDGASDENAFTIDLNQSTLVLKYAIPCAGVICKQLQKRISEGNFSVGGERVVF